MNSKRLVRFICHFKTFFFNFKIKNLPSTVYALCSLKWCSLFQLNTLVSFLRQKVRGGPYGKCHNKVKLLIQIHSKYTTPTATNKTMQTITPAMSFLKHYIRPQDCNEGICCYSQHVIWKISKYLSWLSLKCSAPIYQISYRLSEIITSWEIIHF